MSSGCLSVAVFQIGWSHGVYGGLTQTEGKQHDCKYERHAPCRSTFRGTSVAIGTQKWTNIYLVPETKFTSSTSSTPFLRSTPRLKKFLILLKRKEKFFSLARSEQLGKIIKQEAERAGMPYVNHRWLGGMLTNYKTIRGSIKRLKDLELQETDGTLSRLSKKKPLMPNPRQGKT